MQTIKLKKMCIPLFLATCLTACDNEENYTEKVTPNVQVSVSSNLENNAIYRVTLHPKSNQLPQVGILSVDANGNKRLMLNDNTGMPSYSLEEKNGKWANDSNANVLATHLHIALVEPLEAIITTEDIRFGDYATELGDDSNVIFSIAAGSIIAAKPGECTLTGEIKALSYPGLFQINAITDNCSNTTEITNGFLVATVDEAPARFKLVFNQLNKTAAAYTFEL